MIFFFLLRVEVVVAVVSGCGRRGMAEREMRAMRSVAG